MGQSVADRAETRTERLDEILRLELLYCGERTPVCPGVVIVDLLDFGGRHGLSASERPFLGKGKSGQGHTTLVLGNFDASCGCVWRGYLSRTQHRVLRKHLVVELRDQIVLAAFVLAPNLAQLDRFHCHSTRPY